jgi:hypothetical protein
MQGIFPKLAYFYFFLLLCTIFQIIVISLQRDSNREAFLLPFGGDSLTWWTACGCVIAWQPIIQQPYTTERGCIVWKMADLPVFFPPLLRVQICGANVAFLAVEVQG